MFGFLKRKKQTAVTAVPAEAPSPFLGVVKDDQQFHNDTLKFLTSLVRILAKSYGPLGSNTLIENDGGVPIITKDGYTILENLKYAGAQDVAVHQLLKKVSYNLVKTVGDGSTSAVLSASFMYEALMGMRDQQYTRKQLTDLLDRIVFHLEREIEQKYTHQIDNENRKRVLTAISQISNNNDLRIGEYIANVFSGLSYLSDVRIEEDPRDSLTPVSHNTRYGFSFDRGPAHNMYFGDKSTIMVDKPIVFMSYEFFGEHYELMKKVQQANPTRNIVVITDQTHQDTLNTCMADFLRKQNKIYIIKTYDLSSSQQHDEFLDLAIYLDSDIVRDPATFDLKQLGAAASLELTGTKSVFLAGQGMTQSTPFYNERLEKLQKDFDDTPISMPSVRGQLRIRLSKLNGVSVRILVGGITAEEKQTRRFLVEDAVLACKSALLKGFGFGGNISLFFAANSIANRWGEICANDEVLSGYDIDFSHQVIDRLRDVYYNTFYCIISKDPSLRSQPEALDLIREAMHTNDSRMYDVLERQFQSIEETNVLAPIDTDVQILKASVSIVGMLLSINQLI